MVQQVFTQIHSQVYLLVAIVLLTYISELRIQ